MAPLNMQLKAFVKLLQPEDVRQLRYTRTICVWEHGVEGEQLAKRKHL